MQNWEGFAYYILFLLCRCNINMKSLKYLIVKCSKRIKNVMSYMFFLCLLVIYSALNLIQL